MVTDRVGTSLRFNAGRPQAAGVVVAAPGLAWGADAGVGGAGGGARLRGGLHLAMILAAAELRAAKSTADFHRDPSMSKLQVFFACKRKLMGIWASRPS
jgi:hypothetical protein